MCVLTTIEPQACVRPDHAEMMTPVFLWPRSATRHLLLTRVWLRLTHLRLGCVCICKQICAFSHAYLLVCVQTSSGSLHTCRYMHMCVRSISKQCVSSESVIKSLCIYFFHQILFTPLLSHAGFLSYKHGCL